MPRKAALTPARNVHVCLPETLMAKLDLYLFSEVEGRIPQGSYQKFFSTRITEFFANRMETQKGVEP